MSLDSIQLAERKVFQRTNAVALAAGLEELERANPELVRLTRTYIASLRQEAAIYRRQRNRLRQELEALR